MMRLGKIDYLNLLPFDVFVKSSPLSWQFKAMMAYKKSYPARLNREFLFLRLDAGFFSSILAYGHSKIALDCGIVAYGEVWSVLALPKEDKPDYQSASSNALIQVLGIKGEVLIGDKALLYRLDGGKGIDLGEAWRRKKNLPFVFGLFCASKNQDQARRIACSFLKKRIKIPHYLLEKASRQTGIARKKILLYLEKIRYRVGAKEKRALRVFYRELLFHKIKKPKRFDAIFNKNQRLQR